MGAEPRAGLEDAPGRDCSRTIRRRRAKPWLFTAGMVCMVSCAQENPAAPNAITQEWVREYYELFQDQPFDADQLMRYYSPEVRFSDPTFDIEVEGLAQVRELYEVTGTEGSSYRDIRWQIDRVVIGEDQGDVAIHGHWSGSFDGQDFEIAFVTLWRVVDQRIVEQIDFFDALAFDEQVG